MIISVLFEFIKLKKIFKSFAHFNCESDQCMHDILAFIWSTPSNVNLWLYDCCCYL